MKESEKQADEVEAALAHELDPRVQLAEASDANRRALMDESLANPKPWPEPVYDETAELLDDLGQTVLVTVVLILCALALLMWISQNWPPS